MLRKIGRLFVIKTRFEAFAIIYAIAVGAVTRGYLYRLRYHGLVGWLFFAACSCAVFVAGAKILDATPGRFRGLERRRLAERRRDAPKST